MPDDSDIKIYARTNNGENNEFETLSEDIRRHISTGNREKAIRLGERMAKVKPEHESFDFTRYNFSAAVLYQIRVLITFIAEYTTQKKIKSEFLADSVTNAMYDYLKLKEKGYYDNISDGGAFTFYLLALKKDGDAAQNIGEQFAKRCGINKPEMIKFGAEVFNRVSDFFSQMIDNAGFSDL
jgi:hypothetical protein